MPKKKGKKKPSSGGGCNSAICQVLGVNFTAAQKFGWTLVLETSDVSGQFPITAVDLSACQVSVQRSSGVEILSCKEIEDFISYEVRKNSGASGNDVVDSCNAICDLLNYNLQQETANGWGGGQPFTIELSSPPSVELKSVNLLTCEVTVDTAPTTRNCATIANTWTAFQVHK